VVKYVYECAYSLSLRSFFFLLLLLSHSNWTIQCTTICIIWKICDRWYVYEKWIIFRVWLVKIKKDKEKNKKKRLSMMFHANYWFYLDPCAKVNCNYGRCEVDRSRPVCRCFQGYTGHECRTSTGEFTVRVRSWIACSSHCS